MMERSPLGENRRNAIRKILAGLGGTAAVGSLCLEENILLDHMAMADDSWSMAQRQFLESPKKPPMVDGKYQYSFPQLKDMPEKIPSTKLGKVDVGRVILGGNIITAGVHGRDYGVHVSQLVAHYNTKEKVFETFAMAEECGINSFLAHPVVLNMMKDYWKQTDGKMQFICDSRSPEQVQSAVDIGAIACYVNGDKADWAVAHEEYDLLVKCLEQARKNGVPGGLGAHRIETMKKLVEKGIIPDFWMKTFHHREYWSASNPAGEHDNIFCRDWEETRDFMAGRDEPWIAFKVCAAGAIHPSVGVRFAFESGADFVCLGMFDFQMVENVNIAVQAIQSSQTRTRKWH